MQDSTACAHTLPPRRPRRQPPAFLYDDVPPKADEIAECESDTPDHNASMKAVGTDGFIDDAGAVDGGNFDAAEAGDPSCAVFEEDLVEPMGTLIGDTNRTNASNPQAADEDVDIPHLLADHPELLRQTYDVLFKEAERRIKAMESVGNAARCFFSMLRNVFQEDIEWLMVAAHSLITGHEDIDREAIRNSIHRQLRQAETEGTADEVTTDIIALVDYLDGPAAEEYPDEECVEQIQDWLLDVFTLLDERGRRVDAQTRYLRAEWIASITGVAFQQPPPSADPADDWVPFPTHVLPDRMRTFIESAAASLACDPAAVALPALTVAAAAIGCTTKIAYKEGFAVYPIIWTAIIMPSGYRKSPALDVAVAPVFYRQLLDAAAHNDAQDQADDADQDGIVACGGGSMSSATACPQRLSTDFTSESLDHALSIQPRGILLPRDELAGLFKALGQYKGGKGSDTQSLIELFEGRPSVRNRVGGNRKPGAPLVIPRRAGWITGGMQPATLWDIMGGLNETNGLFARLLLCAPPLPQLAVTDDELNMPITEDWANLLMSLYDIQEPAAGPAILRLDVAAKAAARSWMNETNHRAVQAGSDQNLQQFRSKLQGYVLKFAGIIHVVEHFENPHADQINLATVERAIELCEWFAREAHRIYRGRAEVVMSAANNDEMALLAMIRRKFPAGITCRELQRATGRRFFNQNQAKEYLDGLVEAGKGKWRTRKHGGGGRRPEEFMLQA